MTADHAEIERRWHTYHDRGAHDYTDAGCRVLAEHAFRDIPALVADLAAAEQELDAALDREAGTSDALQDAKARADALARRNEWLHKQLEGCADDARIVAETTGLALSRSLQRNLEDARAALAGEEGATKDDNTTGERFTELVAKAREILAAGDDLAVIAFLTGRSREDVARVAGEEGADE